MDKQARTAGYVLKWVDYAQRHQTAIAASPAFSGSMAARFRITLLKGRVFGKVTTK